MKKTVIINISGIIFHIDEDAYGFLKNYLSEIEKHFLSVEGGREIVEDIENRISELFSKKIENKKEVINMTDIKKVVEIMGTPSDFAEEKDDDESYSMENEKTKYKSENFFRDSNSGFLGGICSGIANYFNIDPIFIRVIFGVSIFFYGTGLLLYLFLWIAVPKAKNISDKNKIKKIYRDMENRVVGGVISGISNYFNIDPIIFRIIFGISIFVYGLGVVFYIFLWFLIPEAISTSQKLKMKGKRINISNIEKSITKELENVKDNFGELSEKNKKKTKILGNFIRKFVDFILLIIRISFKLFKMIIGIFFTLIGLVLLTAFFSTFLIEQTTVISDNIFGIHTFSLYAYAEYFANSFDIKILLFIVSVIVLIPILLFILLGLKLIFKFKSKNKLIILSSFITWFTAFLFLIIISINISNEFSEEKTIKNRVVFDDFQLDTLFIKMNENKFLDKNPNYKKSNIWIGDILIANKNGKNELLGKPTLNVEKSETNKFELIVNYTALGKNQKEAKENAKSFTYDFEQKDISIFFDPYFLIKMKKDKWKKQELNLILKVPEGKTIHFGKNTDFIIYDIKNINNYWDNDMVGKFWLMKNGSLFFNKK